jgi:hypothetical protein
VVLAPTGVVTEADLAPLMVASVTVVSWAERPEGLDGVEWVIAPAPRAMWAKADRAARATAVGRAARRLTPLDPGVGFWRSTRGSILSSGADDDAIVIVAVERDATYAAWRLAKARRRSGGVVAVYGYPAARVIVRGERVDARPRARGRA